MADYARKCRELKSGEAKPPLPLPPKAVEPSPALDPDFVPPPEEPTRANRLRRFVGFAIGRRHVLTEHPEWTFLEAAHYGDSGTVFEQGSHMCGQSFNLWLQRQPGNPLPPLHPACRAIFEGHTNTVWAVAPNADFRNALTGSWDKTLRLWDLKSGACLRVFEGHAGEVFPVAVSPDFTFALSGSADKTLKIWDLESGACLREFGVKTSTHENSAYFAAVVAKADFTQALTVRFVLRNGWGYRVDGDKLRLWDLDSGACFRDFGIDMEFITTVAVSADFSQAISGSKDSSLIIWDLESKAFRVLLGHANAIRAVAASADFTKALSGGVDKTLRLWDLKSGACIRVFEGHADAIQAVAASADITRALSGGMDKTLRMWDLESGTCLRIFKGHANLVTSVAVSADFTKALSASTDQTLRIWDLESGACLRIFEGHANVVTSVAVSADFTKALSASEDKTLRLWDLVTEACVRALEGHTDSVQAVGFIADSSQALSMSNDKTVRLWDLESGACLKVLEGPSGEVTAVSMGSQFIPSPLRERRHKHSRDLWHHLAALGPKRRERRPGLKRIKRAR
jgi:WD40 repeat protein